MAAAWIAFPALFLALAVGWGLLIERIAGTRLPGALIPVTGLAAIVVVGQLLALGATTAELIVPAAVLGAIAGVGLGWREALGRVDGWAVACALGAFAILAAPIVLSGEATFAGYIKLDDTATWMAITDRVMESGRSLDGLAPSTYEATLAFNLGGGYPIGVFVPLGIATQLSGQDVAWTIQPYMAALGALLALGLWQLAAPLLESGPLRAVVAAAGSLSALLYGYYLWGGIKEIAAAALIVAAVALATFAIQRRAQPRALVPLALVCAAEIGTLSAGGALWLLAPLAGALALLVSAAGGRTAARAAVICAGLVVVFSLPALVAGGLLPPTSSPLAGGGARGNLIGPLELGQLAGIWPAGDFRDEPVEPAAVTALAVVVAAAVAAGTLVHAWRRRAWGVGLYVGGALLACLLIWALGSPWIDGKALATASPAIPFAAALGGGALYVRGMRVAGGAVLGLIVGGVLWSNALQYGDADLAPRQQLAELERIGERIDDQGPTLMTEYQPYGARHFLRDADPEAASELRRRPVALAGGGVLDKGAYADLDALALDGVFAYRTLVLRRGPAVSRPPSPYELVWREDFYEVWQRPASPARPVVEHLGLGGPANPISKPSCAKVRGLAAEGGSEGTLLAAWRPPTVVVPLDTATYPQEWAGGDPARPRPTSSGGLTAHVRVPRPGGYEIWLGGSIHPGVEVLVDGQGAGEVRHQLNNRGHFVRLGEARLGPGAHRVTVRFAGADLHPGSGGESDAIGPLALSASEASEAELMQIPATEARTRLCGRRWDWIELVGA
jgi:hypothetical protein